MMQDNGLTRVASPHSVEETIERLTVDSQRAEFAVVRFHRP